MPLPEGTDPAELIERAGADALRERVAASVPFVAFHVDRILERNDTRSAEGRDQAFQQLLPALRNLERGAFGDEILRRVAGRLELSTERFAALIAQATPRGLELASGAGSPGSAGAPEGPPTNGAQLADAGGPRRARLPGAVHRAAGRRRPGAVRDRSRPAAHQRADAPGGAPHRRADAFTAH